MTVKKDVWADMPAGPMTTRQSAFPPACQSVLLAVGLDFLAEGTAAFICDANGDVQWANALWLSFIDDIGDGGADPGRLPWSHEDVIATARVMSGDVVCRRDDVVVRGGEVTLSSRHWVAFDSNGSVLGIAGTIDDAPLIDRCRLQSLVYRERLDDLTKLISDLIWETGPDLVLNYVSDHATTILGLHPRQLTGRKLIDLGRFTDDSDAEQSPLSDHLYRPFENRNFDMDGSDGSPRNFRLSGLPMFDAKTGQFRGYRGTARDVTVETTALGMVRSSRRQLSQAIEATTNGFALFDTDERLQMCNQYFVGMFPKTGALFHVGMRYSDIIDAAIQAGDILPARTNDDIYTKPLSTHLSHSDGFEYAISDGRWVRATDRLTADGTIVDIRTDVSELIRREQALLEAKLVAEAASRSKSEFLANISHELRTPLNAIIGFSELILQETVGPIGTPIYKEYLGDVLTSGRNLLDIINDILDLSKADAGQLDLAEEPLDVRKAVTSVRRVMEERALRSAITLSTYVMPDLPLIIVDQRKLRQILMALISNAVKFTGAGGSVMLDISREQSSGDILFRVTDTGIGIAPEDIEKALRPFGQVDGSLNRKYDGAGLGLPLVQAFVALHQGSVRLESAPGAGTTVTVRLPSARVVEQTK